MNETYWTVNGRKFTSYKEAKLYFDVHGGCLMEKLDRFTAAYVLQSKPFTQKAGAQ